MSTSQSGAPLRVLVIEDSTEERDLLTSALGALGRRVEVRRVADACALRDALDTFHPGLVLSELALPGFSGPEALDIVREAAPNLPFIFVSGSIGEEKGIEVLRGAADDYVQKDSLRRLPTAVANVLRQVDEREERERMQRALRESEERYRAIVESTEDWIWEIDTSGRTTYTNASVEVLLGYPPEQMLGKDSLAMRWPEDRAEFRSRLARAFVDATGWRNWLLRWRHRDGSMRLVESTAHPLLDERGVVTGFRGIDRDVTLRIQQDLKIRRMSRIHAVLSALGIAILRARDTASLLDMACKLAVEQGQFKAAVVGLPTADNRLAPANRCGDEAVLRALEGLGSADLSSDIDADRPSVRAFLEGRISIIEDYALSDAPARMRDAMASVGVGAQIALPIGTPPWALLVLYVEHPKTFDADEVALIERIAADLDYARDFMAKSDRLEFLAYRNPVTGLPNRVALEAEVMKRLAIEPTAVGVMHIAQFGQFNDSRGRAFGDSLLLAIAQRLGECFSSHTYLAHIGGKSFMFATAQVGSMEECLHEIRQRLLRCAKQPLVIQGEQIHLRLHCGIAVAPANGRDLDTLERSALTALTEATRREEPLAGYSEELRLRAERAIELESELRVALDQLQFALFLQPKFDAASRRLVGAEALLRWRHPKHGMVSPAEFIPLLEDSGLIIPVGRWVMSTALDVLRRWRAQDMGDYRIAVNVSARELREQGFVESCRDLIGVEPDHGLDIEVTESLLMVDISHNIQVLNGLRDLGCRIAIDDFGTGYSSLSYLSRLPADELKIDQSFTAQIAASPDALALVTNIISLAHSLSLKVVAEGVEEEEQEKLLRLLRCDQLQGYLLGRPVSVDEFERIHLG